ncbi:MAG TPA: hypothetical protein VFC39_15585 [Acidobacteriaceae bacterium]|nr:hypothetical protein [Acidobacteriaceae bacterium]
MSDALLPDTEPDDDANDDGREFAVDEDALDADAEDDLDEDAPALDEDEAAALRKGLAT